MKHLWSRAAVFAGIQPDDHQTELMQRYRHWLTSEGLRAGGIGPYEVDRIDRRHLADSMLFASQLSSDITRVWDLGSGLGLPGIPLAICMPETEFVLIDRSARRTDLLRRVLRILGLDNCEVLQTEIGALSAETDGMVSRASLPPDELREVAERHLRPGGVAVAAGSWQTRPEHTGWTTIEIPSYVLDQTVWLLIMRRE